MAKELGVSTLSVYRRAKYDCEWQSFKAVPMQCMSEVNRNARYDWCVTMSTRLVLGHVVTKASEGVISHPFAGNRCLTVVKVNEKGCTELMETH